MLQERRGKNSEGAAHWFQRLERPESLHKPGDLPEAGIASEKLVSSKPRKGDFQAGLPCRAAHPVRVDTINRRLVRRPHQLIERIFEMPRGDANLPVIGPV